MTRQRCRCALRLVAWCNRGDLAEASLPSGHSLPAIVPRSAGLSRSGGATVPETIGALIGAAVAAALIALAVHLWGWAR